MLNVKSVIKAFAVSVALTFILSIGSAILFGSSVSVDSQLDWDKLNSMPYSEAVAQISANTKTMSGWETFKTQIQWLSFITPGFFALIASLFAGCLVLLLWVRNDAAT